MIDHFVLPENILNNFEMLDKVGEELPLELGHLVLQHLLDRHLFDWTGQTRYTVAVCVCVSVCMSMFVSL